MIDCLVIAPGNATEIYQGLSKEYSAIEPPIWAAMLTKALLRRNYRTHIIDMDGEGYTITDVCKYVASEKIKLIAIVVYGQQPSASTQNMYIAQNLCLALYGSGTPVILIGGHVSALPEKTLLETKCKYVAKGEGLNTILGLLQGKPRERIPGLYWYDDKIDSVVSSLAKDQQAKDLVDTYPGLAWEMLPMKSYRAHNWHAFGHKERTGYASVYTSLGCPFKCSFCCINAPFDSNSFRYWDPEFMANEIRNLVDLYGVKHLKIADEMFVLNENHFMRLCEKLIPMNLGLNIWCYARVDTVKPKYLETLKKAGVNWLALGIESASKFVRDGVEKGRYGSEEIIKTVETVRKAGIYVIGNYIFGLPDDTHESMGQTLNLANELNCEMANFYSAMAYPGSVLYRHAKRSDLPDTWLGYSQHSYETKPLPTNTLRSDEVLKFRDEAFHSYFRRPEYLSLIDRTFGKATVEHIKAMTEIKLPRKILDDKSQSENRYIPL